jgi:hypothetical protein
MPNDNIDRNMFNAATKVTIGNGKKSFFLVLLLVVRHYPWVKSRQRFLRLQKGRSGAFMTLLTTTDGWPTFP